MVLKVKRKTVREFRYHKNMGKLHCSVTKIYLTLFGILPIKTLHKYRTTYYGEVKDCAKCDLAK